MFPIERLASIGIMERALGGALMTMTRATTKRKPATPSMKDAPCPVSLGPLKSSIGYTLRRAQIAVAADLLARMDGVGLRPTQFSTLLVVCETPGLKQSLVADALGIQRASFVALVDDLQKKGWLDRRIVDRKSYALHLTSAGEAKLAEAMALHEAAERRIGKLLGPRGCAQLLSHLQSIAAELPMTAAADA